MTRANQLLRQALKAKKKPHKYHAQAVKVDGVKFASKAEARRYQELLLLEKAGEICNLLLQPEFPIIVNGQVCAKYIADFKYATVMDRTQCMDGLGNKLVVNQIGRWRVEDTKGFDTPLSRLKRKLVEAQYGITVEIVK